MRNRAPRIKQPTLRTPHSALRTSPGSALRTSPAFSLIELLVVIGVISLLAALSFPVMGAVKRAQSLHRARAEMTQVVTAIETYYHKLGYYPPDNPGLWSTNQLYYELLGTTNTPTPAPGVYQTLDGSASIPNTVLAFKAAFGVNTTVVGFMNCSRAGRGGDEVSGGANFLHDLKPSQFLAVNSPVTCTVLGIGVGGTVTFSGPSGTITPWNYNSSSPQHNPKSFDLWVDIPLGGKTNRVCNWSDKPLLIAKPPPNNYP